MVARDRLTVLHVVPQDSFRGAQVYAGRLRDALVDDPEQEHLVVALFAGEPGALRPDITLGRRSGFMRRLGLDLVAVRRLRATIRDRRAAVVVAHGGESLKYAIAAAGSTPVVYYKIGLSSTELARPSRRFLYRRLAQRAALGVAVSSAVRDQMQDVLGMPSSCLTVIPNGRPPEIYYPARNGLPQSARPRVIFIGQLEAGKRPALFIETIKRVRSAGIDLEAVVVGDGPMRAQLEAPAAQAGVDLLGTRDDVPELLRTSAVLVMTSAGDTEGMPGVLVEAGLSAVPVITTEAAGVRDVVRHDVTGFIVAGDVRNPGAALATRLGLLVPSPELRGAMGKAALNLCLRDFTIASSADQWRSRMGRFSHTEGRRS